MAKATDTITLTAVRDIESVTRDFCSGKADSITSAVTLADSRAVIYGG